MSNSVWPHRQQPPRLPHPWDSPGRNTGVGCHFLLRCMKGKVKVTLLSHVQLSATPWTAACQAPPTMGFSRREYWSGVPLPSLGFKTKSHQSSFLGGIMKDSISVSWPSRSTRRGNFSPSACYPRQSPHGHTKPSKNLSLLSPNPDISGKDLCLNFFNSFTHNSQPWKEPKRTSAGKWINTLRCTPEAAALRCAHSARSDSLRPHGLQPARLLCPWGVSGSNTGMGCPFLLQGLFPIQRSNPRLLCLLHWQVDSLSLSPPDVPEDADKSAKMRNKPLINTIGMNLKTFHWVSKARHRRHQIIRYNLHET